MYLRTILFSTVVLFCAGVASAQRPGPEFWRKVGCEPFEPRTKLEAIEDRHSTVVIKGYTRITTVDVRGVRIDAVEMRELGNVARAKGLIVVLREGGERHVPEFAHLHRVDPHTANVNRRDASETLDYNGAVAVFNRFQFRARLEWLTTYFPPELRSRSLRHCRARAEQHYYREKNRS